MNGTSGDGKGKGKDFKRLNGPPHGGASAAGFASSQAPKGKENVHTDGSVDVQEQAPAQASSSGRGRKRRGGKGRKKH
ncbi:uncharacterized protein JN550_002948 [Neoarthrinium moseri]|uniref:uncharacterized protein n=1 Tax=Neoarthrinium moseri TaxID=1658444 RepID=UPI001FDD8370|nr:uncharacterized protein JN550_002948 [Neoarthrinium moseri]KAI1873679.1 hypothetical protein JN550_002948 [Neoarthrinium moseri]